MKKQLKGIVYCSIGILIFIIIIVAIAITQPKKTMEINVIWMAPMPEQFRNEGPYRTDIEGKQQIGYRIRYIWNGKPDKKPWWIISRLADGKWRVCEPANTDNYDLYSHNNTLFDDRWIRGGFSRIGRSRLEKFQHIVFGAEHKFQMEKETLKKVQELIEIQEKFERNGTDLYESMKSYIEEHPGLATIWPHSKEHYQKRIQQLEKELIEKDN